MPNPMEESLRRAGDTVARYITDAAELTVITQYVEVGKENDEPRRAARTVIKLDGDNTLEVPVRILEDGAIQIEAALYDIHVANVKAASEYRANILRALVEAVQSRTGSR